MMKAIKSCVNKECNSYIHKMKYKDEYVYCPFCGEKLFYVCADCWMPLDHSTEKFCPDCQKKRVDKKEENQQKIMDKSVKAAKAVGTVAAVVGGVVKNGKDIIKTVKK